MKPRPPQASDARPGGRDRPTALQRIVVGADGRPESRDAARLAMMIANATGGRVVLVAVDTAPPISTPPDSSQMRRRPGDAVGEIRDSVAPGARTVVETDPSVPRALERVAKREQADLLVVGSSHHARQGRVRIGMRTRPLLGHAGCALAVAARGLAAEGPRRLRTIGVGYDGGSAATQAVSVAGALARAAGAPVRLRAVADDRLPYAGWTPTSGPGIRDVWDQAVVPELESLSNGAEQQASGTGAEVAVEVKEGAPADELLALSGEVDLLVIGSRHGGSARLPLGSTGEQLMHDARCSMMVVPRPQAGAALEAT